MADCLIECLTVRRDRVTVIMKTEVVKAGRVERRLGGMIREKRIEGGRSPSPQVDCIAEPILSLADNRSQSHSLKIYGILEES